MIAIVDGQARCGRSRGLGTKAPSGPCGSSIVRRVHSKQLIFRIRVLLEYGHHTRVGGEDRKGREQPLSAVSQAGQALNQSVRALRYLETQTVASGSVNLGVVFAANPPILAPLYSIGGPGLPQFMRAQLDRIGRHSRRRVRLVQLNGRLLSPAGPTERGKKKKKKTDCNA